MDKILIIDSNPTSAELISKHLTRGGYDVIIAGQLKGLLINLKILKPDLIILDMYIGNESSFDFCKRLRNNDETKYIPILMVGTSDSLNSLTRAIESGADDYMPKTIEAYIVISKVNSLIRIKHLGDELKERYKEIEEKNNLIEMQLKMAMKVQRSLISEFDFKFKDMEIMSKYLPALEIGGDFYDIINLNDDVIAIMIGDISGNGISAALLTAMLKMMIRALVPQYYNPDEILYHMNNELYSLLNNGKSDMYACVFYAVIDTKQQKIFYSNAGQSLPIFVDSARSEAFELISFGTPIGMMENSQYENKTLSYKKNDILFFYTDGLSDNFYKDNSDEFNKRIINMLADMSKDVSPQIIINSLLSVFYKYDLPKNLKYEIDDVSVILCKM